MKLSPLWRALPFFFSCHKTPHVPIVDPALSADAATPDELGGRHRHNGVLIVVVGTVNIGP